MYALLKLILNRLAHAIPTLVGIIVIAFILLSLAPGDVVDILAADGSIQDAATAAAQHRWTTTKQQHPSHPPARLAAASRRHRLPGRPASRISMMTSRSDGG